MQDEKKKTKSFNLMKNNVKESKEQSSVSIKKIRGKAPGNCVNTSEDGVSLKEFGDLIYEVLSGQLSKVAHEIIAEIELSDND